MVIKKWHSYNLVDTKRKMNSSSPPLTIHHQIHLNRHENNVDIKNICILSSSFNPPTLAHYGLIKESIKQSINASLSSSSSWKTTKETREQDNEQDKFHAPAETKIDAILLLFTTNNPDKPNMENTTLDHRLEMMKIMAQDLSQELVHANTIDNSTSHHDPCSCCGHAIKTIFVGYTASGKFIEQSKVIQEFLDHINNKNDTFIDDDNDDSWKETEEYDPFSNNSNSCCYFIMGLDTIVRFFDPKYYPQNEFHQIVQSFFKHCFIICADRSIPNINTFTRTPDIHEKEQQNQQTLKLKVDKYLINYLNERNLSQYNSNIIILHTWQDASNESLIDLSSSKIRNSLHSLGETKVAHENSNGHGSCSKTGFSLQESTDGSLFNHKKVIDMVSPNILSYIQRNRLYRSS